MDFLEFKTGPDDQGRRLDKVLRIFAPSLSLSEIYKSLRKGLIKVNQKKSQPDYRIKPGDIIYAADFLINSKNNGKNEAVVQKKAAEVPKTDDIKIVFENEHFLVLDKPAGINIHPAKKNEYALTDFAVNYYNAVHKNDSLSFKPGPLHRLDKMTGGLVCFSMSSKGAKWFSQNMKDHQIKKTYIAVVQGNMANTQTWTDLLQKQDEDAQNKDKFHTVKVGQEGKTGITKAIPVKSGLYKGEQLTVVEFKIETGRQHQIRSQSGFHGFPLWGDTAYGGNKNSQNDGKYLLFAYKLEFGQNELGLPPVLQLEYPDKIKQILNSL
jgi:23S rRNA pseudouridine955/2504/2580 synthase